MTKFIALVIGALVFVHEVHAQPRSWDEWNRDLQQQRMQHQLDDMQANQRHMDWLQRQQQLQQQSNCIMRGNYNCP